MNKALAHYHFLFYLAVDIVVRAEHVADVAGLHGIKNAGFQINKDRARDVLVVAAHEVQ